MLSVNGGGVFFLETVLGTFFVILLKKILKKVSTFFIKVLALSKEMRYNSIL